MGKVYRAIDKEIKEEVALKLIKHEIASDIKTLEVRNGYSGLLGYVDYPRRHGLEEGMEKGSFTTVSLSLYHSGY